MLQLLILKCVTVDVAGASEIAGCEAVLSSV